MSDWISVEDRLPIDLHCDVLLLGDNEFSGDPAVMVGCMDEAPPSTTHWMPLPEPPK